MHDRHTFFIQVELEICTAVKKKAFVFPATSVVMELFNANKKEKMKRDV